MAKPLLSSQRIMAYFSAEELSRQNVFVLLDGPSSDSTPSPDRHHEFTNEASKAQSDRIRANQDRLIYAALDFLSKVRRNNAFWGLNDSNPK